LAYAIIEAEKAQDMQSQVIHPGKPTLKAWEPGLLVYVSV
jgi:hypothetical protein